MTISIYIIYLYFIYLQQREMEQQSITEDDRYSQIFKTVTFGSQTYLEDVIPVESVLGRQAQVG